MSDDMFVDIHGRPWKPNVSLAGQKPKPKKEAPAEWHKGWQVLGILSSDVDSAALAHGGRVASWEAMSDGEMSAALSNGKRHPGVFDREQYAMANRKPCVRLRPFESEQAAKDAADFARRLKFEFVEVVELAKRSPK